MFYPLKSEQSEPPHQTITIYPGDTMYWKPKWIKYQYYIQLNKSPETNQRMKHWVCDLNHRHAIKEETIVKEPRLVLYPGMQTVA